MSKGNGMKKNKKNKRHKNYVVTETLKVDVFSVLRQAVEKYGAKDVLKNMAVFCNLEYLHYTDSMAILLADKLKIENAEAGKILFYLSMNWDELVKKANDYYQTRVEAGGETTVQKQLY